MVKLLTLLSFILFCSFSAFAESVVKRQLEIGPAGYKFVDPEFEPATMKSSFQDLSSGMLYACQMDPVTGDFKDYNFSPIDKPAPIYTTFNGPEWGYSVNGPGIYFTKADPNGYFHIFRYRDGNVSQLDSGKFNLVANYTSKSASDSATMVMGANFPPSSVPTNPFVLNWGVFSENNPSDIRYFPMTSIGKGPRFVPGARQVTTNLLDSDGTLQIGIFDFDSGQTKQVTFDRDPKNSATVIALPELNDEAVLSAMVVSKVGDARLQRGLNTLLPTQLLTAYDKATQLLGQVGLSLRIYRKGSTGYLPYREVRPQSGKMLMNAQSFTFKGKTYYSMEQFTLDTMLSNHQIVIQDLEGKVNLSVGDESEMVRFDPEVVISGDRIFVYYYSLPGFKLYMSEITLP